MNQSICPLSSDGRHNFAIAGHDCMNGCGVNQAVLSGGARPIKSGFEHMLERIKKPPVNKRIHSELHEMIDKMRNDFGETAKKGVGSFSYYLGMLKKVPTGTIYLWLADIKDSTNLDTPLARAKIFWWKYKTWKKAQYDSNH